MNKISEKPDKIIVKEIENTRYIIKEFCTGSENLADIIEKRIITDLNPLLLTCLIVDSEV
jgi:hypothetical protein